MPSFFAAYEDRITKLDHKMDSYKRTHRKSVAQFVIGRSWNKKSVIQFMIGLGINAIE